MISSSEENGKYCVVSDIDVEPMPPQQLFDQRTMGYLSPNANGYVFHRDSCDGTCGINFLIFNKEKEGLREAHYNKIIKKTESVIAANQATLKTSYPRPKHALRSYFVETLYDAFRQAMNEPGDQLLAPRKTVQCPPYPIYPQYPKSDPRAEILRFDGDVVCTLHGRNNESYAVEPIAALANWTAEPLEPLTPES
jgi:hypothetical protein